MILTGPEIERERADGRITIEPFTPEQVNPNSYNFRLGRTLRVYRDGVLDARAENRYDEIEIPDDGYVLEPGHLYLAHTVEVLGSEHYAPTFAARSSVARLGVFINLSASLGDIGYCGQWTLQLYSLNRVRVYPGLNIGQMMWWRPQGDVALYAGKYQGSTGPRSSDLHVDFEKQIARQRLPHLRASVDVQEVGPKFAALSAAACTASVPEAFCIPAGELDQSLDPSTRAALAEAFDDLQATVGAFFGESTARIEQIAEQVVMSDELARLVRWRVRELVAGRPGLLLAVRSSGIAEDTAGSSLAGVHDSVLGVTQDDVVAAVERCWRSVYAPSAIAARLRAGDLDWTPRLAVFVQRQVEPVVAGVAFTGQDGVEVVVEYVEGLADVLVSGVTVPVMVTSVQLAADQEGDQVEHRGTLTDVVALARDLHERHGRPVDVEWAADADGVHLVQVRPQTSTATVTDSATPWFEAHDLYTEDLSPGFTLGEVAGVYGSYVGKRAPAYRLAVATGVAVGRGWVCRLNGKALADDDTVARLRSLVDGGPADECVLDLGEHVRQIVVPKERLVEHLTEFVGGPSGTALRSFVMRDFLRGELGMISRLAGDGIVVEFTADGLMALNRGTAGARALTVPNRADLAAGPVMSVDEGGEALVPHLDEIVRLTEAMRDVHGEVTLEWVLVGGRPHFVDYSALGQDVVTMDASGIVQISPGTARGPLLRLRDDALLARLSVGPAVSIDKATAVVEHDGLRAIIARVAALPDAPIVHASRPYAVLSVLIGHVAGFVFDQGSTLGHLPILLREAGVPAVAVADLDLADGTEVVVSDGTLTTLVAAGARA